MPKNPSILGGGSALKTLPAVGEKVNLFVVGAGKEEDSLCRPPSFSGGHNDQKAFICSGKSIPLQRQHKKGTQDLFTLGK